MALPQENDEPVPPVVEAVGDNIVVPVPPLQSDYDRGPVIPIPTPNYAVFDPNARLDPSQIQDRRPGNDSRSLLEQVWNNVVAGTVDKTREWREIIAGTDRYGQPTRVMGADGVTPTPDYGENARDARLARLPPTAAPTVGEVIDPSALRGQERVGSGGYRVDTTAPIRAELEAEGISQQGVDEGLIRIGDLIGPPSRFGLPDQQFGSAFPDRLEDSPVLDQPIPAAPPAPRVDRGTAMPDPGLAPAGPVHDPRLLEGPSQLGSAIGSGLDAILQGARRAPALGLGLEAAGTAYEHVIGPAMETSNDVARAVAGGIAALNPNNRARGQFESFAQQIAARTGLSVDDNIVRIAAAREVFKVMPGDPSLKFLAEAVFDPFNAVGLGYEGAALRALQAGLRQAPRAAWWAVGAAERGVMGRQTAGLGAGYFAKYAPEPVTAMRLAKKRERELLGLGPTDETPSDVAAELRKIADSNDDATLRRQYLGPDAGIKRVAMSGDTTSAGYGNYVEGTSLPKAWGTGATRTPAGRAYAEEHVTKYRGIAEEIDQVKSRIEDIDKDPLIEWGSLTPEEQFIQLLMKEPDGAWENYLSAYRRAQTAEERADLVNSAREHGTAMQHVRYGTQPGDIPFGTEPPLVGDSATALLTEQAQLVERLRTLTEEGKRIAADAKLVEGVPQLYTVRPKVVNGYASTRRFELVDPQGQVFATVSGRSTAQRRAGELNLARANAQLPGTPEVTAPDLVLENQQAGVQTGTQQGVDESLAKATATPGGEQQTLTGSPVADLEVRTRPRAAEPGQGAALLPDALAPTIERVTREITGAGTPLGDGMAVYDIEGARVFTATDADGNVIGALRVSDTGPLSVAVDPAHQRKGVATKLYDTAAAQGVDVAAAIGRGGRTQAGLAFTEAYRKKKIAELSKVFEPEPAMEAQLEQARVGQPSAAQAVEAAAPIEEGPRFVFRDGAIFDTKRGVVDDLLTARIPPSASTPGQKSASAGERWARWANKKVTTGEWREHQAAIPPGQKLVPEAAEVVEEGQKVVPASAEVVPGNVVPPPPRPPRKRTGVGDDGDGPRDVEAEGPDPLIWRVVDNADGSASLSKLDLETGLTIKGEKFSDRNSALLTAEQRNAENKAVTMVQDALEDLRRTLEPEGPPVPALMSPGQARDVNRALAAERKAAEREAKDRADEVAQAREEYRKRVADDPGWRVTHPGEVPPKTAKVGKTPLPGAEPSAATAAEADAAREAARETLGTMALLRGIKWRDVPLIFSTTSRLFGTALDAGSLGRQMVMLGVRDLATNAGRDFFPSAKALFESYLSPEIVTKRAHAAYSEALSMGGGKLHFRGAGEFTGERVSETVTELAERIPVAGEAVRRSSVAFNSSINMMGSRRFVSVVKAHDAGAAKRGLPPMSQEVKDKLAWSINHSLGYGYDAGNLGKRTQMVSDLASMLYSPQWQASRAAVLIDFAKALPRVLTKRGDAADVENFWNGVLFAAGNAGTLVGIASVMGVDIDLDPRSTNFARLPLGAPGPETAAVATVLSGLGVSVNTYNDTVYVDFSAGIGADLRLLAQLFPVGGDYGLFDTPLGSARAINAAGAENDPWNPQGGRDVLGVTMDWLLARGDPRTRGITAGVHPFKSDDRNVVERLGATLISSYVPMLLQDAMEAAGVTENLTLESIMEQLDKVPSWFSQTPATKPSAAPQRTAAPAGAGPKYKP